MFKCLQKYSSISFFLFLITLTPQTFGAVVSPRPIAADNHIKIFTYMPENIYKYVGYYGIQTSIVLDKDEIVGTLSMGDSSGWQITPKENRIFLKPIGDNAETNATLITNKRVYYFEMHADESLGLDDPNISYEVRFDYPEFIDQFGSSSGRGVKSIYDQIPDISDPEISKTGINFLYSIAADQSSESDLVAPLRVFDDKRFTYMKFPSGNTELPAVFEVDMNGNESLVNYRVLGDYIIIEKVKPVFTLRAGAKTVCVFNEKMIDRKVSFR